ncbi:hypothetical protein JCM19274_2425 [Algibacter lectus]|uniref:DUF2007 domain-containing protein n=1 Tax=Algibacter lectus TaxID=221126 RepID=A0A090X0R9_9FLAO|nr:hypothetical protein [Algibacter lectus]GAL81349.1 hypothetical protein JCM19274_2425 [Algibacter lectus]
MTDSNYIKVFSGDFIVVKRIISDLENENITAVIKDETESARLAGFGGIGIWTSRYLRAQRRTSKSDVYY